MLLRSIVVVEGEGLSVLAALYKAAREATANSMGKLSRWMRRPAYLRRAARQVPEALGRWGMYEFVEPHVRRLVAEHLGVEVEALVSTVSLREDLAADSLDLVELTIALEAEFAIGVPERLLDRVRTYGELVHAIGRLIRARCGAEARGAEPPLRLWARLVSPAGEAAGTLEWTGWLTPYVAETIAEDAVRAGRGAHLEVTVAASTGADLARVQHQFTQLGRRGVQVSVRGLRAQFDLPTPSPNGFRPLTATFDGASEGGDGTLSIQVSAQVSGKERLAQVSLRRGSRSTMDVRFLPAVPASGVIATPAAITWR